MNVKGTRQDVVDPFIREIAIIEKMRNHNIVKYLVHHFLIPRTTINVINRDIGLPKTMPAFGSLWNIVHTAWRYYLAIR